MVLQVQPGERKAVSCNGSYLLTSISDVSISMFHLMTLVVVQGVDPFDSDLREEQLVRPFKPGGTEAHKVGTQSNRIAFH